MERDLGPEIERFRAEMRDWIAAQAPPALAGLTDWRMAAIPGGHRARELAEALKHPAYAQWERTLADARLICPQWPAEFGGQDMDAVRIAVLNEEFYRAGVPRVVRGMGEALVGPSVIVHGTQAQREHFLPRRGAQMRTGWSRGRPRTGSCCSGRTAWASSTLTRPPARSR